MKNILLIGSNGNLGSELKKIFAAKDYNLITTTKLPNYCNQLQMDGFHPITLPKNLAIDLVINAANKYYVEPSFEETRLMKEAIIGVAESLLLSDLSCPIVYFSSYLQYLPENMQPWSKYTEMKSEATKIFREYGNRKNTGTLEITLYDNYGGQRKNKFFDLVLETIVNKKYLKATPGDSVINLTHIADIATNLASYVDDNLDILNQKENLSYSIKTKDIYTLRNLVAHIESVSKKKAYIEWNSLPYRNKEIFQYYDTKQILPGFAQNRTLNSYISTVLNS